MDHWRAQGPAGPYDQWQSKLAMKRFLQQVAAVGFDAIDTFDFRIWQIFEQYGSVANYQDFVQEQGLERIVNTFHGVYYSPDRYAPEVPATHPTILDDFQRSARWSTSRRSSAPWPSTATAAGSSSSPTRARTPPRARWWPAGTCRRCSSRSWPAPASPPDAPPRPAPSRPRPVR